MALLNNGFRHSNIGRVFGATLIDGANIQAATIRWSQSGRMDNSAIGEGYDESGQVLSYPDDMNTPYAYHPAQVAGRMASYSTIIGSGTLSPDLRLTLQALADLVGSGDVEATGGLIVQLLASLAGNGAVSDADMKAFLLMVANISGSGIAAANISALAQLLSSLQGSGVATSTLTGTGAMSANILAYGELTPEGIRDSVWNALASQYNSAGTMGGKVNDAGAAGNPWAALLADNVDPDTFGALLNEYIDAKISDVKAKTDSLTFTVAGQVDSNVQSMNDAEVIGDGTAANLWRGE